MRTSPPYEVVIADPDECRCRMFADLLEDVYESKSQRVGGLDELKALMATPACGDLDLVILAQALPGVSSRIHYCLSYLHVVAPSSGIIAIRRNPSLEVPALDRLQVLDLPIGQELTEDRACQALAGLLPLPVQLPTITYPTPPDHVLLAMVRTLGREGQFEQGENVMQRLVRKLWGCEHASLSRLTQGYSGAKVFRIDLVPIEADQSFALKLSSESDLWKLENEVDNWEEIEGALDDHHFRRYLPQLCAPVFPSEASERVVEAGGFYAVAYQFLGAGAGEFLDLGDAYTKSAADLDLLAQQEGRAQLPPDLAGELLEAVVRRLRQGWYDQAVPSEHVTLWDGEDALEGQVLEPPPYCLTAKQKAHLLASLEMLEDLGSRLLLDTWQGDCQQVASWLAEGPPATCALAGTRRVAQSPVHGDLNSSNILTWFKEGQPFLIDFACYQQQGHTLQDFARLEAEVKFALMDTESDSPVPALDRDPSRLRMWMEAESQLASENWEGQVRLSGRNRTPVRRAVDLVRTVRLQAREVQAGAFDRAGIPTPDFLAEYAAALLYHTLRAVGYDSLSTLKRLLAVRSAAELIRLPVG